MKNCRKLLLALTGLLAVTGFAAEEEKTSERCALCHEQETKEWQASKHAQAMNPNFLGVWEREGKKWECLVCHTSQSDRKAGTFSHAGISCESCHGAMKENHPDDKDKEKGKMLLPVNSELCQTCHSITYGEWRISAHGQKGIRCFDCHKMHGMQLRKDDPDQMCGSCHTERLKDFSHATHHVKGVQCIACHMPEVMGGAMKIKGAGLRGHTFGVGAETCTHCHREMVHQSHETASLEQEVARLKATTPESLERQVNKLTEESAKLHSDLQASRRVFMPLIGLAFVLGVFAGFAVPHFRSRKPAPTPKEP